MSETAKKFIRQYIELHGDPFEPSNSMSDYATQTHVMTCWACGEEALARWPHWDRWEIKHKPDCGWLAYREWLGLLGGNKK